MVCRECNHVIPIPVGRTLPSDVRRRGYSRWSECMIRNVLKTGGERLNNELGTTRVETRRQKIRACIITRKPYRGIHRMQRVVMTVVCLRTQHVRINFSASKGVAASLRRLSVSRQPASTKLSVSRASAWIGTDLFIFVQSQCRIRVRART